MRKRWKRSAAAVLAAAMSLSTFLSAYAMVLDTPYEAWWSEEAEAVPEWYAVPDPRDHREESWWPKYEMEVYRDGQPYWDKNVAVNRRNEISKTRRFLYDLDRSGTYKFRVKAVNGEGGSDWSEFSEEWNFQKPEAQLPKPQNLHWEGTACTWDVPELTAEEQQYLLGWAVTVYGDGEEIVSYTADGNSCDMAEDLNDPYNDFGVDPGAVRNWSFDVRAISDTPSKLFHGQEVRCGETYHAEKQGWKEEDGEWHYYTKIGTHATNGFVAEKKKDSGKVAIYYVDETGRMLTNCRITIPGYEETHFYGSEEARDLAWYVTDEDRSYYAGADGALVEGKWIQIGDQWIYASKKEDDDDDGGYQLVRSQLKKINGKKYYFDENCYAQSGLVKLENEYGEEKRYYFDPESLAMVTNSWQLIDDGEELSLYHFTKDGSAQTEGEEKWNGITYEFDEEGRATAADTTLDKWEDEIASPSTPSNAAKLAKKTLEAGVEKYGSIAQADYDTEEKAESFLDRLIDFFLAPFTNGIQGFEASPSEARYQEAVDGTKDAPDGTDGYIKKQVELFQYHENADNELGAFTATASVALKITPEKYNPDAENPDQPDVPEPEQPDKPSRPSSGGGSGSRSVRTAAVAATGGLTPTPGSWKQLENGQWMMLDPNGAPYRDTWLVYQNQWYFVNPDGIMELSWKQIGGRWYYFTATTKPGQPLGSMLANTTTPDGYKVGTDGAWLN